MLKAAVMLLYSVLLYCVIVENIVAITTPFYITAQQNDTFNSNSSGGFTNGSGGAGFPGRPGGDKILRYLICLGFITTNSSSGNGSTTAKPTPLIATTLYNMCKRCNISKTECTCEKEPFLCSLPTTNPSTNSTKKTELRCLSIMNHVKAAVNTITGVIGVIGNALVVA